MIFNFYTVLYYFILINILIFDIRITNSFKKKKKKHQFFYLIKYLLAVLNMIG